MGDVVKAFERGVGVDVVRVWRSGGRGRGREEEERALEVEDSFAEEGEAVV